MKSSFVCSLVCFVLFFQPNVSVSLKPVKWFELQIRNTDFYWFSLCHPSCKKHIRFLKSVILSRAVPKNWKRIDDFLVKLYIKSVAEMKRIYIQIDITTQWGPGFTNIINQKEIVALQKKTCSNISNFWTIRNYPRTSKYDDFQ